MPATTVNLTGDNRMEAGARYEVTIPFVDAQGDPIDLTDYDPSLAGTGGRMMLRRAVDEADGVGTPVSPILSLTPAATGVEGIYIELPATLGKVTITIYPATLEDLSWDSVGGAPLPLNRTGFYDLEVEGAAVTDVLRLCEGPFLIDPEVTR